VAEGLLVGVTAIWGWTFVLVKDAVAQYPVLPFLALRFALAAILVALLAGLLSRGRSPGGHGGGWAGVGADRTLPRRVRRFPPVAALAPLLRGGVLMGLFLGAGYIFQTFGLERTSASNAGFITGLFVVIVPALEYLLWRRGGGWGSVVAVLLATVGLFLLSGGASGLHLLGDGLVFLCALSFAAHILATARYAAEHDVMLLTAVQLGVVAAVCAGLGAVSDAVGLTEGSLSWPRQPEVLVALAVTAVFASALAFFIQTYAQQHAPPARTAVIMTMEPVFAGVFGYVLAGDRLGTLGWLGAALIVAGMLAAILWPQPRDHVEVAPEGQAWVDVPAAEEAGRP
jgi:drug/metabolite transporter (DMT)-like permease